MSRILITGGAGFIGGHLAKRLLEQGDTVDLVDNFSRGVRDPELDALQASGRARLLTMDVMDADALSQLDTQYDVIYHLAAIIGVAHVLKRPYNVLRDNMLMLLNLLDLAKRQTALKRFIFASTSEVYAGTLEYFDLPIPTPETTPLALTALENPRTSYMLSKLYGEALCQHADVPFTIIRPHNFYGPRMGLSHVIPELLKKAYAAQDGGELEVFSIAHKRTFCYIGDAVEMIVRASTSDAGLGQTLNIGCEKPEVTMGELAQIIIRVVGKQLTQIAKPATAGSPPRRCPDMHKTMQLTDYQPKIDLELGVKKTFDWYRANVFDGNSVSAL